MFEKVPLFHKYLISYLVLLIVPLLIIGLLVYQHYVAILKEEVTSNHQQMLEQIKDSFDSTIGEMNTISAEIASRSEFTPYQLRQNMYNAVKLQSLFRNYTSANNSIKEVFLYLKDQPLIYSGASTYQARMFINEFYRYENWSAEQFTNDMNNLERPVLRHSEEIASARLNDDRVLTYLVPFPMNSISPYGSIMFMIEESTVRRMLQGLLKHTEGNTIVLDEDGKPVVSLRDADYLSDPEFQRRLDELPFGTSNAAMVGEEYAFSKVKSKYRNWTYVTMLPTAQFMQQVDEVKSRALLSLTLVIVIGSALIYILLQLNYDPVRRFLQFTGKQWGEPHHNFNQVINAVNKMTEEKQAMGRAISDSRAAVREHLLLTLIKGKVTDPESFTVKARESGIVMNKPMLGVVLVAFRQMEAVTSSRQADILEAIERMMQARFEAYRVEGLDGPVIHFVCAVDPEEAGDLATSMRQILRGLREQFGIDAAIGAGNLRRDMREMGKSYIEASTSLDFRLIKGYNEVIMYSDIADHSNMGFKYPRQDIETMELLIRQGDTESLKSTVRDVLSLFESNAMPLHMVRCICYDMINCILKEMYRLKGTLDTEGGSYPDVVHLTKFDTIQDLADLIEAMCEELCSDIVRSQEEAVGTGGMKREMVGYIRENYGDSQFSVQNMADYFTISASYLKKQFKNQTGKTITEYLNYYRLERAKHLLRTTDMKLKEIVQDIGYNDVPSFIRKFKQAIKVTPGDYRKLYGMNEDSSV